MQQLRLVLDEEQHLGGDAVRGRPGAPVLRVDPDLEMDETVGERRRHAVHHPPVVLPVAAGDPKQAIYRFRGADIAAYVRAREAFRAGDADAVLSIATNFRSRAPITP